MIARENKGPGIGIEYAYSRAATSVANPSPQQVAGLRQSIWVAGDTGAGAGAPESILFDLTKSRQCARHPAAAGPAPASPRHHAEDLHQAERALPGPGGGPALHLQLYSTSYFLLFTMDGYGSEVSEGSLVRQ